MTNTVTKQRNDDMDDLLRIITALTSELIRNDPNNLLAAETARYMLMNHFWHSPEDDSCGN